MVMAVCASSGGLPRHSTLCERDSRTEVKHVASNLRPMTVHLYMTNGVHVVDSHEVLSEPTIGGERPLASYHVMASSLVGAVRAALMSAYDASQAQQAPQDVAAGYRFMVETGTPIDLTLNRLAQRDDTHASDIIERAVNMYANIRDSSEDGYVYVKRRAYEGAQLSVRKIAVP